MKKTILRITGYFICLFLLIIIRVIRPFFLVKFDLSYSSRYGHFVGVNSLYVSRKEKNLIPKEGDYEFFIHDQKICNTQIEKLLRKKINFAHNFFYPLFKLNSIFPGGSYHLIHFEENYFDQRLIFEHRDVYNIINSTNPPFEFNKDEIDYCEKELEKLKISNDDKIIIITLRDENYLQKVFPQKNFSYKTQNVNIDSFHKTIKELTNKGYKVIRTGLHHQKNLNFSHYNYIDLFKENIRSDLLETYLISKCIFQIGSFSGGAIAAQFMFRKISIITNQIPLTELHSWSNTMYVIFKKVYDKKRKKNITTSEFFDLLNTNFGPKFLNAVGDKRYFRKSDNKNIFSNYNSSDFEILDNSEDEIYNVVIEVLEKIESNNWEEKENKKNKLFKKVFLKNLIEFPYLTKFHSKKFSINVSEKFLTDNQNFLN